MNYGLHLRNTVSLKLEIKNGRKKRLMIGLHFPRAHPRRKN